MATAKKTKGTQGKFLSFIGQVLSVVIAGRLDFHNDKEVTPTKYNFKISR